MNVALLHYENSWAASMSDESSADDLKAARELEKLRFTQLIDELNAQERGRILKINEEMNARGLSFSGPRYAALVEARREKIESLIDGRIKIRRDLAGRCPQLCSEQLLNELMGEFSHLVEFAFTSIGDQANREGLAAGARGQIHVNEGAEEGRLKARAQNSIEILKREAKLDLHQKREFHPTIVTTGGSAVVNLNLGTIYGNVQQVIGNVGTSGHTDLAELLADLAKAINDTEELGSDRAAYLEHVEFIAEQVIEPEGRGRKPSLVRTALHTLQVGLQSVANIAQIMAVAGPELAKHFGFPWPT